MAFDGNGNFLRVHNWSQDAANSLDINASEMDAEDNGFAAGLSVCVTRDGQGKSSADFLPAVDNTLNLGTGARRWATINGVPISSITSGVFIGRTAAEITAGVTPTNFTYPPLNVFRYGALGNGIANDVAAFNSAAAVASVSGGAIYVPGGFTFNCATNVNITGNNVRVTGDGDSSIVNFTDTTHRYSGFTWTGTSVTHLSNAQIDNIQLIGAGSFGSGNVTGNGAFFAYTDNIRVFNVTAHEWSDNGIASGNGSLGGGGNNIQVYNNRFFNIGQGISLFTAAFNTIVTGNLIYNVKLFVGIAIEGTGGTDQYTVVSNNIVYTLNGPTSQATGIYVQLCPFSSVTGNVVYGVAGGGGSENGSGIAVFGSPYTTITGNTSYSNTAYGIYVGANCGNCTITGNVTFNNSSGSLKLSDDGTASSLLVVIDNSNNFNEGPIVLSGSVSLRNLFANVVNNKATFTATVVGTTVAGATSGGSTTGEYTVIDNLVTFRLTIAYASTTGTGNIQINGLPFAATSNGPTAVSLIVNGMPITAGNVPMAQVNQSASTITLQQWAPATGILTGIPIPASLAGITISGSYPTS